MVNYVCRYVQPFSRYNQHCSNTLGVVRNTIVCSCVHLMNTVVVPLLVLVSLSEKSRIEYIKRLALATAHTKYVLRGNVTRRAGEQKQTEHMIMPTKKPALSCHPSVCLSSL